MVKKILITGGAGYIGSHISEILLNNRKKVFIIDNLSTGHKKLVHKKATFFKIDILDTLKVKKIILQNMSKNQKWSNYFNFLINVSENLRKFAVNKS